METLLQETYFDMINKLRRVLSVVREGLAKNTKLQCTRIKLLTQPATIETPKMHQSFLIKGLSMTEHEDV